jgi:hypothetical protein
MSTFTTRRALHGDELRPDEAVAEIANLLLGELVAPEAEHDDRHVGRVVLQDERRRNAGRQRPDQGLTDRRHLRNGRVDVGARLEVELDDAVAADRLRLQVLDTADRRRHRPLDNGRDAILHLRRRQPAVAPDHADDGDIDRREDVGRHRHDGQQAQYGDQQRDHHERISPAKGESDNPHK